MELKDRIKQKESEIAQIQERINYWENAKCEEEFIKEYAWCCKDGKWNDTDYEDIGLDFEEFKQYLWTTYSRHCDEELMRAYYDMKEARITLIKYQEALNKINWRI